VAFSFTPAHCMVAGTGVSDEMTSCRQDQPADICNLIIVLCHDGSAA